MAHLALCQWHLRGCVKDRVFNRRWGKQQRPRFPVVTQIRRSIDRHDTRDLSGLIHVYTVDQCVGMAAAQAFIASCPVLSGGAHGSPLDIMVEDTVTDPIPRDSTVVHVRTGAGLGIELDEAVIDRYRASTKRG